MVSIREGLLTRMKRQKMEEEEQIQIASVRNTAPTKRQLKLLIGQGDWQKTMNKFIGAERKRTRLLLKDQREGIEEFLEVVEDKKHEDSIVFATPLVYELVQKKNRMNRIIEKMSSLKAYIIREIPKLKDELRVVKKEEEKDWEVEESYLKMLEYLSEKIHEVTLERNSLHYTLLDFRVAIEATLRNRSYFFKEMNDFKQEYLNDVHDMEESVLERINWIYREIHRLYRRTTLLRLTLPHFITYQQDRVRVRWCRMLEIRDVATFGLMKSRDRPVRKSKSLLHDTLVSTQELEMDIWQHSNLLNNIVYLLELRDFNFDDIIVAIKQLFMKNADLVYHVVHIRKQVNELENAFSEIKSKRLETQKQLRIYELRDKEILSQLETDNVVLRFEIKKIRKNLKVHSRLPEIFYRFYKRLYSMVGIAHDFIPFYREHSMTLDYSNYGFLIAGMENQMEMLLMKLHYLENFFPPTFRNLPVRIFQRNPQRKWQVKTKYEKTLERVMLEHFPEEDQIRYPCFWCVYDTFLKDRKSVKERVLTICEARRYVVRNMNNPRYQHIWHDLSECTLPGARDVRQFIITLNEQRAAAKRI